MGRLGELELIDRIRQAHAPHSSSFRRGVVLGIGDDCALLRAPRGHELAVTTDMLLEGRHFRRDWHPADSAGHRALARGLSDLAAMGARPVAAFLSLALPSQMLATPAGRAWVDGFFAGLRRLGKTAGVILAGGDTAESPANFILADIVLIGSVPRGKALRRSNASPGDLLYVTGALGGAAAELQSLAARTKGSRRPEASAATGDHPQLYPEPRVSVGLALIRRGLASAAIDLSDGLSTDLAHLCRESNVTAEIEEALLPMHPLVPASPVARGHALHLALNGGEDYELLFTARPGTKVPRGITGVTVTQIGRVTGKSIQSKNRVTLIDPTGQRHIVRPGGWEHLTGRR
ncbi:MAG: thiamine-phosphate kinase [Acidobacteriaceae bacterium]